MMTFADRQRYMRAEFDRAAGWGRRRQHTEEAMSTKDELYSQLVALVTGYICQFEQCYRIEYSRPWEQTMIKAIKETLIELAGAAEDEE